MLSSGDQVHVGNLPVSVHVYSGHAQAVPGTASLGPVGQPQVTPFSPAQVPGVATQSCAHAMIAKLHIHPIHEAFGMQVLEASAVGCPSIIVQGSGSAELYQHRISGLHPKGDPDSFACEIDWAFDEQDRLKQLSMEAYKVALNHSWANHSHNLINICKKVLT